MTNYNKWEIVLVPFPFTDLSASKKRPDLIYKKIFQKHSIIFSRRNNNRCSLREQGNEIISITENYRGIK